MTIMLKGFVKTPVDAAAARAWRLDIEEFHADYCAILDENRISEWPSFFTEDAIYRITGRENVESDMPVGLVYCQGMGMFRDRALAIGKTEMYAPRYLHHLVSNVRVLGIGVSEASAQSNYIVLQTLVDEKTTIHQAGHYFDRFVRVGGRLLLRERHCVYDSLLIDNSLVMPV
jgi:anthranilate 1,2-dioxygenase small subunit